MSPVSLSLVRQLSDTYGFTPSRALGQNFLIDANVVEKIASFVPVGLNVLEIGPGLGSLSIFLAKRSKHLYAIEYDKHILEPLQYVLNSEDLQDSVTVLNEDIMKVDIEEFCKSNQINFIAGNLPYNISAPLIADIAKQCPSVSQMIVMVQKEVGERLLAKQGSSDVSAVTLKCQYFMEGEILMKVSPQSFFPKPKVDSIVIKLSRYQREDSVDVDDLFGVINTAFSQKRKMLRQSLKVLAKEDISSLLIRADIDPTWRAQQCNIEDFMRITNALKGTTNV